MMAVSSGNKQTSKFYCRKCRSEERRPSLAEAWRARAGNGNEQNNGATEKRKRGRRKGTETFDRPSFRKTVEQLITQVRQEKGSDIDVTSKSVAEKLQLDGVTISGKALVARLRLCGIKEAWPRYRERVLRGASQN
jgi:hypothetical protein